MVHFCFLLSKFAAFKLHRTITTFERQRARLQLLLRQSQRREKLVSDRLARIAEFSQRELADISQLDDDDDEHKHETSTVEGSRDRRSRTRWADYVQVNRGEPREDLLLGLGVVVC